MSRYKLVKIYPNSPELGTIVEKVENGESKELVYRDVDLPARLFKRSSIENYPDNWQIIKEVVTPSNINLQGMLGQYVEVMKITVRLKMDGSILPVMIQALRRTRDNLEFKIGDKISVNYLNSTQPYTIKEFRHRKLDWFDVRVEESNEVFCFSKITKFKQSLFKTKDGVVIRESDTYWYLVPTTSPIDPNQVYEKKTTLNDLEICPLGEVQFADKHKAYAHMLARIPCMSILDVGEVFKTAFKEARNNQNTMGWDNNTFKLLKIVERKLKSNNLKTEEDE